jgi:hypothetical protein
MENAGKENRDYGLACLRYRIDCVFNPPPSPPAEGTPSAQEGKFEFPSLIFRDGRFLKIFLLGRNGEGYHPQFTREKIRIS